LVNDTVVGKRLRHLIGNTVRESNGRRFLTSEICAYHGHVGTTLELASEPVKKLTFLFAVVTDKLIAMDGERHLRS
jgi:hypothetical protein